MEQPVAKKLRKSFIPKHDKLFFLINSFEIEKPIKNK